MTVANDEYDEFSIEERIWLNAGTYEGEHGVILSFGMHDLHGVIANVELDSGVKVGVLIEWLEHEKQPDHVVNILKHGMSSADLAEAVHMVMHYCMDRVNGVGHEQYAEKDHQKFEAMSMEDLMEYQIEEIADDINYAVMRFIRLRRIQNAMSKHL